MVTTKYSLFEYISKLPDVFKLVMYVEVEGSTKSIVVSEGSFVGVLKSYKEPEIANNMLRFEVPQDNNTHDFLTKYLTKFKAVLNTAEKLDVEKALKVESKTEGGKTTYFLVLSEDEIINALGFEQGDEIQTKTISATLKFNGKIVENAFKADLNFTVPAK